MDMTTPMEELFSREHLFNPFITKDTFWGLRSEFITKEREYGELKQSPRWVKASERKPEKAGKYFFKLDGEPAGVTEYSLSNILIGGVLDAERVEWLDESGSPEPEAKDVASEEGAKMAETLRRINDILP